MNNLFEPNFRSYGLPEMEKPQTEAEIFHSFIDSINNAIGNKAKYDLNDEKDKNEFIDNYLEEFIFCMHNDEEFNIVLLNIPEEFKFFKKDKELYYSVQGNSREMKVSESNKKEAVKIYKNPQNGIACFYRFCPKGTNEPIFLINFSYSDKKDEKEIVLYKKVIADFIELKEIKTLEDMRRIIIASYKVYKNNSGEKQFATVFVFWVDIASGL